MGSSPAHFDILEKEISLDDHALLEASAGTGKTFSIEHLVARHLLSGIRIDEILALTFTKKAARELKERIQSNLRKLVNALEIGGALPSYVEPGKKAKEALQAALFNFDSSLIATIHSFAERSIEKGEKSLVTSEEVKEVVKTFLRFGLSEKFLSQEEIPLFLKEFRGNIDSAIDALSKEVERKEEIEPGEDPFSKVAAHCQLYFRSWKTRHKKYTHDDTLLQFKEALSSPEFVEGMRRRFRVVIVDEFQDTDSLQWEIFETLFLNDPLKRSRLFLVGDPKQAIYSFRGADIYTYLEAAKKTKRRLSLLVNWRGRESLVKALNRLFEGKEIPLPKEGSTLSIPSVEAGNREEVEREGEKKALHVLYVKGKKRGKYFPTKEEEEKLLSIFAQDIQQTPLQNSAVLVRDRNQGERVQEILKRFGIPSSMNREEKLSETRGFFFAKLLLKAIKNPENLSHVKAVLTSPLLSIPLERVAALEIDELAEAAEILSKARTHLEERGILAALSLLFHTPILGNEMALEIKKSGFLFSFMQAMEELTQFDLEEIESRALRQEVQEHAVQILTIHASKGLEFDTVFPLGILSRSFQKERWRKEEDAELLDKELVSEKLRLLYVALTRAKRQLYLPLALPENEKKVPEERERSLIECFAGDVASFAEKAAGEELFSFEEVTTVREVLYEKNGRKEVYSPLPVISKRFQETPIVSFTQLAKGGGALLSSPPEGAFPHGGEAGVLLHLLFEKIPWGETDLEKIEQFIRPLIRGTILEPWERQAAERVQSAFLAPLGNFSLKDVKECETLREVSFLYKEKDRFVKGVIDLIFRFEGEYYLLDWKSNWLGSNPSDYSNEAMALAMEREEYTLQSSLYQEALSRYLKQLGINRSPKGSFYLFLRGLSKEQKTGVYFL